MTSADPPTPDDLLTLDEFADVARVRLAQEVWDYIEGGAMQERTLTANRAAFAAVRLLPRVLTGSGPAETSTRILGREFAAPLGVAPCAYHTIAHPDGELATVHAAAAARVPFIVSTYSGRLLKEIGAAAADTGAVLWQQLYCLRDRAVTEGLVHRAEDAGVAALILTVDTPHLGKRLRDLRNRFRLPPGIAPAEIDDPATASPADHARLANDAALDWSVIEWLRTMSPLPLLLKGVLTAPDAVRAVHAGVAGLIVSNHGGRQLDGVPATLEALPAITSAVNGNVPVLLDGGVRTGTDVLSALALGANAVLIGRPVLHGLAVDGERGAQRVLELLTEEFRDAMTLAGAATTADLGPTLVDTAHLSIIPTPSPLPPLPPSFPLQRSSLHASLSDPDLDSMAFLNEIADRYPEAVSFAPGRPYEGFFEVEDVFAGLRGFLDHLVESGRTPREAGNTLYQYGPSAGIIRELIADTLRADEGIEAAPEAIVVTVGAQEAMLLVVRALCADPRDVLLVSTPCYVGIIGAAKLLNVRLATIPERGAAGLSPADVECAIETQRRAGLRPRALYLVPDHSNPSGNTLTLEAREELLHLSRQHGVLLIEDSPYRLVGPEPRLPTLKALETANAPRPEDRTVVHIGSFAKSMFPGARVGYVVADQPVRTEGAASGAAAVTLAGELARIKSMVTLNTSPVSQAVVAGTLLACRGRLSELNQAAARHYGENLRTLRDELDRHFPVDPADPAGRRVGGVDWNTPQGGFFLTFDVPFAADAAALFRSAEVHGVLWTPMSYFYPEGGGERQIRLSFSALTPDRIREGVARLAAFISAEVGAA
jgi:(S)-3,5-dihydroxyphenylglycine transaminase